jgi:3'-phosphoadenosine 5'-phosphosulfate sulfotransferase (PAPS reductase)/FAD synthetase
LAAIGQKAGELSCDLALIGLRKDESRGRRILLASRGNTFYARGNQIVQCYPLANWTAADVWSYILKHDLPYPSLYDLAENRETARNGAMFAAPTLGHYRGQMAALKRMYPALFNKFAADFPEVSAYV